MCKSYREDTEAVKGEGCFSFFFLLLAFLKTFDQVLLREAELPGLFVVPLFPGQTFEFFLFLKPLATVLLLRRTLSTLPGVVSSPNEFLLLAPLPAPLLLVNLLIMCFSI